MASETELEDRFKELGAVFLTPAALIAERLRAVRAVVFDWDGVFNTGVKGAGAPSAFSEPDSMGTNLLRYAIWRVCGSMPVCAIVSGEDNETARRFATREHFHEIYTGVRHKSEAIADLCTAYEFSSENIAFVFDDINDLGVAAKCGVRIMVRRDASPLLQDFVAMNSLCDYITANEAGRYPVRETAELLVGLLGEYDSAVASRVALDGSYEAYFSERQSIATEINAPK